MKVQDDFWGLMTEKAEGSRLGHEPLTSGGH